MTLGGQGELRSINNLEEREGEIQVDLLIFVYFILVD